MVLAPTQYGVNGTKYGDSNVLELMSNLCIG
jgi:hypothetical protein